MTRRRTDQPELPLLRSGLDPATYATSTEAAINAQENADTQRLRVAQAIHAADDDGHTDDELQDLLGLPGDSERPRRWELWKLGLICLKRDANGNAVRRPTRRGKQRANVWIWIGPPPESAVAVSLKRAS